MEERRRNGDTRIDVLTERVENWMETTTEYRKSLCSKIDIITTKLDALPCPARIEMLRATQREVGWLQKGGIALISCLFGVGVWVGVINTTVTENSGKWSKLEPEHIALIRDVSLLKQKSYGYNDIPMVVTDGKPNRI